MNVKVLIDAIVRQNMVLVAQLSTVAGVRAPLAHVANQVFLELVQELEAQGLRQKVIADMFGLALRSYQRKVQRLLASETDEGRSLWEAVLTFVSEHDVVSRVDVLQRFRHDDEAMVRGVLDDLVSSGIVYRRGRGSSTVYRYADDDGSDRTEADAALTWVAIYRQGPVTFDDLCAAVRLDPDTIEEAVDRLQADGRVREVMVGAQRGYATNAFFSGYDEPHGWEAALFDHYQAVVTAISTKLRGGTTRASRADVLGGSTYSFDIWDGHPFEERVLGMLRRTREEADQLLTEVHAYNTSAAAETARSAEDRPGAARVSFYVGQSVRVEDEVET